MCVCVCVCVWMRVRVRVCLFDQKQDAVCTIQTVFFFLTFLARWEVVERETH